MFILSALKNATLHPRTYYAEQARDATPKKAAMQMAAAALALTLYAALTLFWISIVFSQNTETGSRWVEIGSAFAVLVATSFIYSAVGLGFFFLSALVIARLMGGKATWAQHVTGLSIAARHAAFVTAIVSVLATIVIRLLPGGIDNVVPFSMAMIVIQVGYAIYAAWNAVGAIHQVDGVKSLAIIGIPALLFGFVLFFIYSSVFCCSPPEVIDSASMMKYDLKSIVASGYGITQPKKTTFAKDSYIDARSVIGDSPVSPDEVGFFCHDPLLCANDGPLNVQEGASASSYAGITVNQNTQAYVVVCGNGDKKDIPRYCVGIGRQPEDARTACSEKCLGAA